MVDYASIESVYRRLGADLDLAPGNVFLNCCPLFHGTLVWNLAYLAAGSTVTMLREFTPQAFLRLVERARVTHVFMVPSMLRFTLAARALRTTDLSSLSQLVYGGAPMPRALLDQALAVFPCGFRNCYGITEAGGPVTCLTPDDHRASASDRRSSVGRAHAGYEMRGYWRNPAASNVVLRAGWVYTGDIGYLDDDGYLFMGDRRADLIISAGENVYPAEIEAILQLHPAVLDATVIGVPDEALGEVPWAYVVSQSHKSVSAEELYAFCAQRLARHKLPARIQFLAEIPRSDIGKPLRRVLRQLASA
jgi:acyl-CoA synthetase (AMP-forming)/AMP-acid ligase II